MTSPHACAPEVFFHIVTTQCQLDISTSLLFFIWIKKRRKPLQTQTFSLILGLQTEAGGLPAT